MGINYDAYVDESTKRITELLSSDIDEEEKQVIISALTDDLSKNIGSKDSLSDSDYLIGAASISYIDHKLSSILSDSNSTQRDYDKAISLCKRQKGLLQLFAEKKWSVPSLKNGNLDECEAHIKHTQDAGSITTRILQIDKSIDGAISAAEGNLSVAACDDVFSYLDEMNSALETCKRMKVTVPHLNNSDTKKVYKRIAAVRKTAEQKELLHQNSYDLDQKITNIASLRESTPTEWREIIALCQKQNGYLDECSKKRWPLPKLNNSNIGAIIARFSHYATMEKVDCSISAGANSLNSNRVYKQFIADCSQQMKNIGTCQENGWSIPRLINADPDRIKANAEKEKAQKDKAAKVKRKLIGAAVIFVAIIAVVIFAVVKSHEGKIQVPFSASYAVGLDCDDVVDELENAGFENIKTLADNSGWLPSNQVISVNVDNSDKYEKGAYYLPDVTVTVKYSCDGRKDASKVLSNWQTQNYTELVNTLKTDGFTNVTTKAVDTSDKSKDQLVSGIILNQQSYTNGYCYLPLNAPIEIAYYTLKIGISSGNAEFVGQDYQMVVNSLEEDGFTNVQTEQVLNGWAKGNTVVDVTINNTTSYKASDTYSPDVKIVVKYSSNDRIEATQCFANWAQKDYQSLQSTLKTLGFTNITVKEEETTSKTSNHLVASITLNKETYTGGDCFLQKTAPIVIEYYRLKITTNSSDDEYEDYEKYSDLVDALKGQGFTNIELQRSDDLNWFEEWGGWIWSVPEGSIKSIIIDGVEEFESSASFFYDAKIVIVVNTYKGKGCEDIAVIAK